jgi:HlyD family secretion protein
MNPRKFLKALLDLVWRRPLLVVIVAVAVLAVVVVVARGSRPTAPEARYYPVKRSDFLISIVEGGTLEAVREEVIRSEVEGTARIISIVPEGSYVKKGDLLVELDSSASQDTVNQQQINVEKAQFAVVQAEQQLDIQKSVVDSDISAAQLKVEFAQTDLEKFLKGEALQTRRNAQIEITNVLENQKINEERLQWTEQLYKQGYETKANLDKDRLAVSQTALKLEQTSKELWMIETFDEPKKKRQLEAAHQEARENLERVKLQGDRRLAQFKADMETQKTTLQLSKTKLERDLKQLKATKVYAPQDGLVVYGGSSGERRFSSESMIEGGAVVRNRQELIKLPDVSAMKLVVKIHETYINQIQIGQPAYIVLDASPDQRFRGAISRVAPLPDSQSRWANPNLKVYVTEILVSDALPNVKPGVSARAEIVITNLPNALSVPIQAVTTRKGQQVVFLANDPQKPVPVTVGMYNIKFIEICSGVKEGDRVLLSPPFDTEEKDMAGSILTNGEKVASVSITNRGARANPAGRPDLGLGQDGRRNRGPNANPNFAEADSSGRRSRDATETAPDANDPRAGLDANTDTGGNPDRESVRGPRGARQPGQGNQNRANREDRIKEFDTNGDGKLDESEQTAMREKIVKQFDTNGDGKLDESEQTAMREKMGRRRSESSTNAPVQPPSEPRDASR